MMDSLIINELSLVPMKSHHEAREVMDTFVQTVAQGRKNGFQTVRLPASFAAQLYHVEIAPDYRIAQWVEDPQVDRMVKQRFKSIAFQSPLLPEPPEDEENDWETEVEVQRGAQYIPAQGLTVAYISESPGLSFASQDLWSQPYILVNRIFISREEEIAETPDQVRNIADRAHYAVHEAWFTQVRAQAIATGNDLWKNRRTDFPNLVFCGESQLQLTRIGSSNLLARIRDQLRRLNEAVESWNAGEFSYARVNQAYGLNISPESVPTMNRYGHERRFRLPDGGTGLFELHLKIGRSIRIHILPDSDSRTVFVGYIGSHLHTVSG